MNGKNCKVNKLRMSVVIRTQILSVFPTDIETIGTSIEKTHYVTVNNEAC